MNPRLILAGFILPIRIMISHSINALHFFGGNTKTGIRPELFLLITNAVTTWIFGKPIVNVSNLPSRYGIVGGIGYALYCEQKFILKTKSKVSCYG